MDHDFTYFMIGVGIIVVFTLALFVREVLRTPPDLDEPDFTEEDRWWK